MTVNYSQMLTAISEYNMTPKEEMAYRVVIIYLELANKYFPKHIHEKIPKGDPRESWVFDWGWKLVTDTKGQLKPREYREYITAQLQIFKKLDEPLVSIKSICGPRAWKRWEFWKSKYSKQKEAPVIDTTPVAVLGSDDSAFTIRDRLAESHKFLKAHNVININDAVKNKSIKRWVGTGAISEFYVLLHPKINQDDDIGVDPAKHQITNEIKKIFEEVTGLSPN